MRRRTGYFGALVAFVVFVALFVFEGRAHAAVGGADAMSAPCVPVASVEPAPGGQLLQSHFNGCGHALQSADLPLTLRAILAGELVRQESGAVLLHYGPLYRRPPPSFS